jgi:hypothetical protein
VPVTHRTAKDSVFPGFISPCSAIWALRGHHSHGPRRLCFCWWQTCCRPYEADFADMKNARVAGAWRLHPDLKGRPWGKGVCGRVGIPAGSLRVMHEAMRDTRIGECLLKKATGSVGGRLCGGRLRPWSSHHTSICSTCRTGFNVCLAGFWSCFWSLHS